MSLERVKPGQAITAEWANSLVDSIRQLFTGPDCYVDAMGVYRRRIISAVEADVLLDAKVTAHIDADSPPQNRWKYSWVEVELLTAAYTGTAVGWATKSGGQSGTNNAFNEAENMNSLTGIQGDGVDVAHLLGTFALKPVPVNEKITLRRKVAKDGGIAYLFNHENGVDGECV